MNYQFYLSFIIIIFIIFSTNNNNNIVECDLLYQYITKATTTTTTTTTTREPEIERVKITVVIIRRRGHRKRGKITTKINNDHYFDKTNERPTRPTIIWPPTPRTRPPIPYVPPPTPALPPPPPRLSITTGKTFWESFWEKLDNFYHWLDEFHRDAPKKFWITMIGFEIFLITIGCLIGG